MRFVIAALLAGGCAVLAQPLWAQAYIDVEGERAAQASSAADTAIAPTTATSTITAPAPSGGQNFGGLLLQLQQLQQEVMMLRGKVEEQEHQIRQLKQQSLERYVDLDRRLGEFASGAAPVDGSGSSTTPTSPVDNTVAQAGESDAYRAAYSLVRSQQFDDAVAAFKGFLGDYPSGKYAANAHYWLGELYLVIVPQDLESSRQAFSLLLDQYPDNNKVPDALYKIGKVYYMKGNPDKGREFLDRVIAEHGASNSSAVKLARDFISENY